MCNINHLLECMFPNSKPAREHFYELLTKYQESGRAPPHLLQEMKTGKAQKLWAGIWEAMLYRHFTNLGFRFRKDHVSASGQKGPDLGLIHDGRTIWIEAVVPEPKGLPPDWLAPYTPGEFAVRSMPHEKMLLRWTSALRDKNCQLRKRLKKNIVGRDEIYIVAINSCLLSDFPCGDDGITTLPFAVEAVFPIGPYAVNFSIMTSGASAGPAAHTYRPEVIKPNTGAQVPTGNFFDREYEGISALIGCSRSHMLNGDPYLIVVHNPLARNPLPRDLFGTQEEYVAEREGDQLKITRNPVQ